MLARVITLRFDAVTGSFDDRPLRDFLKDKEVLSIRDHFFIKNDAPYLTMLVTYYPTRSEATTPAPTSRHQQDTSWRALLTDKDLPLFNTLRDWRAERSKREGVPPYVICTNRQLAAMVQARPQSLHALGEVDGFGKVKLEKYGPDILALLSHTPADNHGTPFTPKESDDEQP